MCMSEEPNGLLFTFLPKWLVQVAVLHPLDIFFFCIQSGGIIVYKKTGFLLNENTISLKLARALTHEIP